MPKKIPLFQPSIEREEFEAAQAALDLGWLGMGSFVRDFEAEIGAVIEAPERHVVAVSTGHAALHLGLLLAGVGPGDEVITPSFNNVADFQAILATGAEPVLCDIDEGSLCMDLDKAAELIGERTRAIVPTDYACMLCDHTGLAELAESHDLRVLHDAAHSFGSRYRGRSVGSFSDMTMFSFDPVKSVTAIDGGALVVRTVQELERMHEMRLMGMGQPATEMYENRRAWTYDVRGLGFRYHLANLHAAIGLAQIRKLPQLADSRRKTCRAYNEAFSGIEEVRTPATDFADITPMLYYVRVAANVRDDLRQHLTDAGVDTGIHWQPGHRFTLLRDCRHGDLSVTERASLEILSLPLHGRPGADTIDRVVDGVSSFFERG